MNFPGRLIAGCAMIFCFTAGLSAQYGQGAGVVFGQGSIQTNDNGELVRIMADAYVSQGERYKTVAVIGGNATVSGEVEEDLVVIGGTLTLDGRVRNDVVVVGGKAVLGPLASIGGDFVAVGTHAQVDPLTSISGDKTVVIPQFGPFVAAAGEYFRQCIFKGRFVAFELPWTLLALSAALVAAVLISLLFAKPFESCMDIAAKKPLLALLAGALVPIAVGPVLIALTISVIGILAIPVVWLLLFWALVVGSVAVAAQAGMHLARAVHSAKPVAPVVGAVIGLALFGLCATVPFVGGVLTILVVTMGSGVGVLALLGMLKRDGTTKPQTATTPPAEAPDVPSLVVVAEESGSAQVQGSMQAQSGVPVQTGGTVATFKLRAAAALLDIVVVFVLFGTLVAPLLRVFSHDQQADNAVRLLLLLVYLGAMWAWKQTTVGGIVFKLKLRRENGTAVTPAVAFVRALGLLLSIMPAGLGFLWIAWDEHRQGWHDKIAGTMVYRVKESVSLI